MKALSCFVLLSVIVFCGASGFGDCAKKPTAFDKDYSQWWVSFPPPFSFDDANGNLKFDQGEQWSFTPADSYNAFSTESEYKARCTGAWSGWGSPGDECVSYCRSSVNLILAMKGLSGNVDDGTEFKSQCVTPPIASVNVDSSLKVGAASDQLGLSPDPQECSACAKRDYVKSVESNLQSCLKVYSKYAGQKSDGYDPGGAAH